VDSEIAAAQQRLQQIQQEFAGLKPRKIATFAVAAVILLLWLAIGWVAAIPALTASGFALMTHFNGNTLLLQIADTESRE